MTNNISKTRVHRSKPTPPVSPEAAPTSARYAIPAWVTESLIELTLRVWQPYYRKPLTRDDALSMLLNVSQLRSLFSREPLS